jgi:hypothetical protein
MLGSVMNVEKACLRRTDHFGFIINPTFFVRPFLSESIRVRGRFLEQSLAHRQFIEAQESVDFHAIVSSQFLNSWFFDFHFCAPSSVSLPACHLCTLWYSSVRSSISVDDWRLVTQSFKQSKPGLVLRPRVDPCSNLRPFRCSRSNSLDGQPS